MRWRVADIARKPASATVSSFIRYTANFVQLPGACAGSAIADCGGPAARPLRACASAAFGGAVLPATSIHRIGATPRSKKSNLVPLILPPSQNSVWPSREQDEIGRAHV